mmetsp:Transcript_50471/g.119542  ORF Transcript_50471/g.119542 Transcript_50471/m.119542 type:complete len:258 (-) Transcript_50471:348-1121(-)
MASPALSAIPWNCSRNTWSSHDHMGMAGPSCSIPLRRKTLAMNPFTAERTIEDASTAMAAMSHVPASSRVESCAVRQVRVYSSSSDPSSPVSDDVFLRCDASSPPSPHNRMIWKFAHSSPLENALVLSGWISAPPTRPYSASPCTCLTSDTAPPPPALPAAAPPAAPPAAAPADEATAPATDAATDMPTAVPTIVVTVTARSSAVWTETGSSSSSSSSSAGGGVVVGAVNTAGTGMPRNTPPSTLRYPLQLTVSPVQ